VSAQSARCSSGQTSVDVRGEKAVVTEHLDAMIVLPRWGLFQTARRSALLPIAPAWGAAASSQEAWTVKILPDGH
jgi:hypothetical protein